MKNDEKVTSRNYDSIAREYHDMRTKENPKGWFYNELLEMPATLELLGNVRSKKILDFGCGTGIYAKLLTKKGAIVKGFDISGEMIKIAKEENPNLDLRVGSGYKIPFREKFDIVFASLVVHYLEDWDKMFREVKKVLKTNGYFIFSTGNPVSEVGEKIRVGKKKYKALGINNYFRESKIRGVLKFDNGKGKFNKKISVCHRTYETIIKTIIRNGFEIVDYRDAFPIKKSKKLFPKEYEAYSNIPFFSVWKVMKK